MTDADKDEEIFLEKFKLIQDKEIYSDDKGKLIGWEQQNNTIVLFAGSKESKHVEDLDDISFPTAAVPGLIEFLQKVNVIPVCGGCGGDLTVYKGEPEDVSAFCPVCDNRPEPKKCACGVPKPVMRNTGEGQQHFVCDTCKGIADDWVLDIWKHMSDAGDKVVPFKPQYVRGGWIYTCPLCGYKISSHSYINVGSFQIACDEHIKECIEKTPVKEQENG